MTSSISSRTFDRIADLLRSADQVLVGAGAGLTAAAGIDYTDTEAFERVFPFMLRHGVTMQMEAIGRFDWSPELLWGYWATHVNYVRFTPPPHDVYDKLVALIGNKDHFVITSNVDCLFTRNGLSEERIFTPQGNYAFYQCRRPCTQQVWEFEPVMRSLLANQIPITGEVPDAATHPRCPNCGGQVFLNVRIDAGMVETPYVEQSKRFRKWISKVDRGRLLVLEAGAGFNTPSVVRWPMEQITHHFENAHLVRINSAHPEVPVALTGKATPVKTGAGVAIEELAHRLAG